MATKKELRQMWSPKRKEMNEQCASCPFRNDNDAEWGAVVDKLAKHGGVQNPNAKAARMNIHMETMQFGDFICHCSAYDVEDMSKRPSSSHRQCPGATRWFKETS